MEETIRQSIAFLKTVIDAIPDPMLVIDRNHHMILANRAARALAGEMDSRTRCLTCYWLDDRRDLSCVGKGLQCPFYRVMETKAPAKLTHTCRGASGEETTIEVVATPIVNEAGEVELVMETCRDITEHKQAEKVLRESAQFYRTLIETLPVTVVLASPQGRATYISPAAKEMFDIAPGEGLGTVPTDWIAPEHHEIVRQRMREVMVELRPEPPIEYKILKRDRTPVWAQVASAPVLDGEGRLAGVVTVCQDVTPRKLAEEALRENEQRLRLAIQGAEMGWWDWDLLSGKVTADDQCKALWGLSPTTHPSYELTMELAYPEDRPLLQQRMQEALAAPDEHDVEFRTVWPNGTVHWILLRGRALRDDGGRPMRLMGLAMDVTARKQAEDALRKSETRFRALYEQAPLGIALINSLTGQFLQINPKYREIIRRSEEEMRQLTFQSITHAEDLQADLDNMARLIEGKNRFFNIEKRLFRGDGSLVWGSLTVVPMWEEGQLPHSHIAIIEDITERRQAEEALRESQERLRLALESAELGWWSWDFAAGSIEGDDKTKSLLGLPEATFPFAGILGRTHPDDRASLLERTTELQSREGSYEFEFRVAWPDGSIHWISFRGRSLANAGRKPVRAVGIAMDITERKRAEEDVAASKATAEEANRAKDHFLAVLSHELRTPLTPVVMGVSMLQDRPDLDPAIRGTLEMIRRHAEMEARLIDDLLDVTRIVRGKVEINRTTVELCTVIQRAVEVCMPDIEARGLEFGVDLGPSAPYWIEADVSRLQQVFWNLMRNAIKFTPHGGCVGIRCRPIEDHVVVEVNDSGVGIEPETLPRIFNAFEQGERSVTRQFGGLGLGLSISKALVEMHGGKIEAHSEGRGKGATFRVRLPLTAPTGQAEATATAAPQRPTVRPLQILLVEDHGITAKIMAMMLSREGHAVETAGDMATALELADRHAFDLLVSDLGLPDGSGHDLMRELRDRGHNFPGIALSGYGQEEDIKQSRQAGFTTHLTKPASREAVVAAIASVIRLPALGIRI